MSSCLARGDDKRLNGCKPNGITGQISSDTSDLSRFFEVVFVSALEIYPPLASGLMTLNKDTLNPHAVDLRRGGLSELT